MSGNAHTAMDEVEKGAFVRKESTYRKFITADGSSEYPAEAGRYHLYVAYACPWASRCLAMRKLKGLEDVISLSVVAPKFQKTRPDDDEDKHHGWAFLSAEEEEGCIPDPVFGAKTVRDIYEKCGDTSHKYTVPILFDKKTNMIVNNESSEIMTMFNTEFNAFAKVPELDMFPKELQSKMDAVNEWIYPQINNGVYRAGFAQKQEPYDVAVAEVFDGLDKVEEILKNNRYITGNQFCGADIRLFVTLVRFDEVYVTHFKCNKKRIADYPNIENYVREIYQMPGMSSTVNMSHIKHHYYGSHPTVNPFGIVPVGPGVDYTLPHDRERLSVANGV